MKKSIIIDFDHTIGCFEQMVFIINVIEKTYNTKLSQQEIGCLLDQYPQVFRPKLFDIFHIILFYEQSNELSFFILYTCNNKPEFVKTIIKYIESKLNLVCSTLFDFMIFEKDRIKSSKNIINILPNNNSVSHTLCFIDNHRHKFDITSDQIKYIKSETYIYDYDKKDLLNKFPYSFFNLITKDLLQKYLNHQKIRKYKHRFKYNLPYKVYEMNSSFIIQSIRDFISL